LKYKHRFEYHKLAKIRFRSSRFNLLSGLVRSGRTGSNSETKRMSNMQSKSNTKEKIEGDGTGNDWMRLLPKINPIFLILGKIELLSGDK
jgi:hypothetical protein